MPLATPTHHANLPSYKNECEHCGAPITWASRDPWGIVGQWSHDYPSHWYGQMICDPQQARAAQQGRQPHHV